MEKPKHNSPEAFNMVSFFVDNAEIGLYVADYYTCEILYINRKMEQYTEITSVGSYIGKPCWKLINPKGKSRCPFCPHKKLLNGNGASSEPYTWELYMPQTGRWLKVTSRLIAWNDCRIAQFVTTYDITELKRLHDKLANQKYIDRLLQIKNGLMLEWEAQESSDKLSLIVFDILQFQKVNDTYGRNIGDCMLFNIRDWITSLEIRASELYRVGGDKFCFSLRNIGDKKLKSLIKIFVKRFAQPWILDFEGSELQIFCDATIAVILNDHVHAGEPLLNLIERTIKTAKERKALVIYDKEMDIKYKERLKLEFALKRCTRENMDGFSVYYQPITEPSGRWRGLEALCRWEPSELGRVSPDLFIPEAERLELIGIVGDWVLEMAVIHCKELSLDRIRDFMLHVNLSPAQFTDEALASRIIAILKKHNYPKKKLCVEITETGQFTFTGQSFNTIIRLRDNNIQVALDDFGTGYANYYQLKSIPADIMKIERALIYDIQDENFSQNLFHAMADLAHSLNMQLIAEGVESKEQIDILVNNGADYMQGYFFSKPLSFGDLKDTLYHFDYTHFTFE